MAVFVFSYINFGVLEFRGVLRCSVSHGRVSPSTCLKMAKGFRKITGKESVLNPFFGES